MYSSEIINNNNFLYINVIKVKLSNCSHQLQWNKFSSEKINNFYKIVKEIIRTLCIIYASTVYVNMDIILMIIIEILMIFIYSYINDYHRKPLNDKY